MFLTFLPAVAMTTTDYGFKKITQTLTLGLLAFVAPLFLLSTRRDVNRFLWTVAILGTLIASLAILGVATSTDFGRYQALNANTITTGRLIGAALIVLIVFVATRTIPVAVGLPPMVLLALALVGTGSRGPLLGLAIALVLVQLTQRERSNPRRYRGIVISGLATLLLFVAYQAAPISAQSRLFTSGISGAIRLEAWRATLAAVPFHPLGIGWGNWQAFVGDVVSQGGQIFYPHNLIMEVFLEGGWVAGLGLIFALIYVGRTAFRLATDGPGKAILALYIFFVINALVSDDLINARVLLVVCGLILAYRNATSNSPSRSSRSEVPQKK